MQRATYKLGLNTAWYWNACICQRVMNILKAAWVKNSQTQTQRSENELWLVDKNFTCKPNMANMVTHKLGLNVIKDQAYFEFIDLDYSYVILLWPFSMSWLSVYLLSECVWNVPGTCPELLECVSETTINCVNALSIYFWKVFSKILKTD